MKTRILLTTLFLISFTTTAQNIIRIRPQHQKEHLYTLKEGERIGRNESNLEVFLTGADYRFMTIKGSDYYEHTRAGKRKLIGKRFIPTIFKNWMVKTIGDEKKIENRYTNQVYGPIKQPGLLYDYSAERDESGTYVKSKSDLYGIIYSEERDINENRELWQKYRRKYFVIRPGEEVLGPFYTARIRLATEDNFIYTYTNEQGSFLVKNDAVFGPYEELSYDNYAKNDEQLSLENELLAYKTGEVWNIDHDKLNDFTFSKKPRLYRRKNNSVIHVNIVEKENKAFYILADGSIEENSKEYFVIGNKKGGKLIFKSINDTIYGGYNPVYQVSFEDSVIGEFHKFNEYNYFQSAENSDYFEVPLVRADSLAANEYYNSRVFYSPSLGFTEEVPNNFRVQTISFLEDGYALHNSLTDSLFIDGDSYGNVVMVDFMSDPGNWWMLQEEGDYEQPYKNGQKSRATEAMPKMWNQRQLRDKDFIIVSRGDEYFIKPRVCKRLLGPVEQNAYAVLSTDEQNYAECKRTDNTIWINDKLISSGFYLVYNDKMDAFHWLSILDENKIYLHTYELN